MHTNSDMIVHKCLSALPGDLVRMMRTGLPYESICVAGGFIRSVITDTPVRDIDVFCRSDIDPRVCAEKIAGEFTEIYDSDFAYTIKRAPYVMQFVHAERYRRDRIMDIINQFDFTVCQVALVYTENKFQLVNTPSALNDITSSILSFCGTSNDAHRSLLRAFKYYKYGFIPDADCLPKILHNIGVKHGAFIQTSDLSDAFNSQVLS